MEPNLDDGLQHREVTHHLRVLSPDHTTIVTTHVYKLKAMRPTRFFQRGYTWSGTGVENRPEVEPKPDGVGHATHKLQGAVIHLEEHHRIMVVDLGMTLQPSSNPVEVKIRHRFVDTGGTFKPQLDYTAYEGCRAITLIVTLPRGDWGVEWARRHMDSDHRDEHGVLFGEAQNLGRAEVINFKKKFESPTSGMIYSIEWNKNRKIP